MNDEMFEVRGSASLFLLFVFCFRMSSKNLYNIPSDYSRILSFSLNSIAIAFRLVIIHFHNSINATSTMVLSIIEMVYHLFTEKL